MEAKLAALRLVLMELGISANIDTVNDRKLLQKTIYMTQAAGIDLGYRYGWYLMGPYSPTLTRDYYELSEYAEEKAKRVELKPPVKKTLTAVKELFAVPKEAELEKEDWLELLSSVHFLRKVNGYDKEEAHRVLKKEKPHLIKCEHLAERALRGASLL